MAEALGVALLDRRGKPIPCGGEGLLSLAHIDLEGRDPRLEQVPIDVACNWHNVLCGPRGVARIFGPQKGASPATVRRLERDLGLDVRQIPGGGASGGLGAGLVALLGARLHPRFDIVLQYQNFDALLDDSDLVITAEGGIDGQTVRSKVPAEVVRRAKERGQPAIAA